MAKEERFSTFVGEQLRYYVYRLIDPRNGETFYVGKGKGNRVFAHVKGELDANDDALTEKLARIREIRLDGFEVAHVLHRHGMTEDQAFEVEAALIDAYPEVTNEVYGRYSDERGLMHSKQAIERYEATPADFQHNVVLITINRSAKQREVYEAVRYAWKLDPKKARAADFVLAVQQGVIVGAFVAERWLPATIDNFPGTTENREKRWGFIGRDASPEIAHHYLRRRIPESMRKPGAANPVRYAFLRPDNSSNSTSL
ncbi:LEM-3-like GIY-YIG domain-containing protein [Terrarubrum flagellatum]|uniref:LEM-3-like GIY-YIG domain-containing protein n=1 Tax=Terrirubrum flagellatum TaxID=2895980 RepID=UPI003144F8D8